MGQLRIFISYAQADRQWAEWIAWQLEAGGHSVQLKAWDFVEGSNFVTLMNKALQWADVTMPLLSSDFLESKFGQAEWTAAFTADPLGSEGRLIPVRVRECEVQGLLAPVVRIELVGLGKGAAIKRLIAGIKRGRRKPVEEPGFPPDLYGASAAPKLEPLFPRTAVLLNSKNPQSSKRLGKQFASLGSVFLCISALFILRTGFLQEQSGVSTNSPLIGVVQVVNGEAMDEMPRFEILTDLLREDLSRSRHLKVSLDFHLGRDLKGVSPRELAGRASLESLSHLVVLEFLLADSAKVRLTIFDIRDELRVAFTKSIGLEHHMKSDKQLVDILSRDIRRSIQVPEEDQIDSFKADFEGGSREATEAYRSGIRLLMDWKYGDARKYFIEALSQDAGYAAAKLRLAQIVSTQSYDIEKANRHISEAMAMEPEPRLLGYLRAEHAFINGRLEEAASLFEAIYDKYPDEVEARHRHASVLIKKAEFTGAINILNLIVDDFPSYRDPLGALGDALLQDGDCDSAEKRFSQLFEMDGSAYALHQLAESQMCRNNYGEAIALYERVIEEFNQYKHSRTRLPIAQAKGGLLRDAEESLRRLTVDTEFERAEKIDAAFELTWLLRSQGRFEEAINVLEGMREKVEKPMLPFYYVTLGLCFLETGQGQNGVNFINKALNLNYDLGFSKPTRYLFARGLVELYAKDIEAVRATAGEIQDAQDGDSNDRVEDKAAFYLIGLSFLAEGKVIEALEYLEDSVELGGYEYSVYRLGLAQALKEADRLVEAREQLRMVAERTTKSVDQEPYMALYYELDRNRSILLYAEIARILGENEESRERLEEFSSNWKLSDPGLSETERAESLAALL